MNRPLSTLALAAFLACSTLATSAIAAAPMVKTHAPGYYRVMVGDFEVTAISDGTVKLPMFKLLTNLKAAGYQPEQVDEIYIPHMHPDHVGGLMAGNALAFPNAVLRIDKADRSLTVPSWCQASAPYPLAGIPRGTRLTWSRAKASGWNCGVI